MPDHIEPIPTIQGHSDWPAMLRDLEKRVETLSDALEGVKLSMRRLVLAEPWLEGAIERYAVDDPLVPDVPPVPIQTPAPVEIPLPIGVLPPLETSEPVASYIVPADIGPVDLEDRAPVEYDDDAREAVRRAVQDAKADMPDDWRDGPTDYVTEDKPDVSWITVPDDGSEPEPLPNLEDYAPDEYVPSEESHEALQHAVDETMLEAAAETDPYASYVTAAEDEEASREAVRRAVEEAKAEMASGTGPSGLIEDTMPEEEEEDPREAVRRAVEQAKAEMGFATPLPAASADDEEAAREAVRQAVAQTRAEMSSGTSLSSLMEGPKTEPPKNFDRAPAFVVPPPHRAERVHPPTITIEDPEGRVELAAVYNLLKHLNCAASSSLLNYSSRQVSVQLSEKNVPDGETVAEAVRDVFERQNEVQVDGLNVIVKLGSNYIRAA